MSATQLAAGAALSHRTFRLLLAAILAGTGVLVARPMQVRAQDETFADHLFVETAYLPSYDHAALWVFEEVDPTSIPRPEDFTVWIGDPATPEMVTEVDFVYQGLRGVIPELPQGTALLEIRWSTPVPAGTPIRFEYTPGTHPLRDLAGNQMPAVPGVITGDISFTEFADVGPLPFIDEGTGPGTLLLFFAEPFQADLPLPGAFSYSIDGAPHAVTAVERRRQDLGATFLFLTLSTPIDVTSATPSVELFYDRDTVGSPKLRDRNNVPIESFSNLPVPVTLSPTPSRQTDPGTNVTVQPVVEGVGAQLTTITFDSVTVGGTTTVTASDTAPELPVGFSVGDPPTFYDIETTATFPEGSNIRVCIRYGTATYTDPTALTLLHFAEGAWEPATNQTNDQLTQTICGDVTSLSPFGVVQSLYDFTGFFSPVDNPPTLNAANGGQGIPVKFSLGGDFGLEVFASPPSARRVSCPSESAVDPIEEVATSQSGLTYDAGTDRYTFVWKTLKAWGGSCRELVLTFVDGNQQAALFRFN